MVEKKLSHLISKSIISRLPLDVKTWYSLGNGIQALAALPKTKLGIRAILCLLSIYGWKTH